jgi:beta-galactosidase
LNYQFEEAHKLFPNRVLCTTESKPSQFEEYWSEVEMHSYVIGDFLWTSWDYLGEAGIGKLLHVKPEEAQKAAMSMHTAEYPWRAAYGSDYDLLGFARPQSAFHRIIWGSDETYIAAYNPANYGLAEVKGRYAWGDCSNNWTYPDFGGKPIKVEVYSNADEVELTLNGTVIGREIVAKMKAVFETVYQSGTLVATSFKDGKEISRDSVHTVVKATKIKITPEKSEISADGQSLSYCLVEIIDENGERVPFAEVKLTANADGAGTLAAFGTARPKTDENYTKGEITTFEGRTMAIVRAGYEAGIARLEISGEGFETVACELYSTPKTFTNSTEGGIICSN